MSLARILAIMQRHLYLYRRSPPRIMEIFFWPLMDLLVWGFITIYLRRTELQLPSVVLFFIGALILWDLLYRAQQGISISFLEEIWSKNLLNLFITPLSPGELLAGLMAISVIKMLMAGLVSALVAWLLYSFNLFVLGLALIPLTLNLLVMGWAIGMVSTAAILRYGQQAEVLAWGLGFLIQPVAAVFYPVSVLPAWIQPIALLVPASHVFEGMRAVLETGVMPYAHLIQATLLNGVFLTIAIGLFYVSLRVVKKKGLLMQRGME